MNRVAAALAVRSSLSLLLYGRYFDPLTHRVTLIWSA